VKKYKSVFRILYWILMACLLIVEPFQYRREALTKAQLESVLPKDYLPAFYEQVEELDFYFLKRETPSILKISLDTICLININKVAFWHTPDVYVIKEEGWSEQKALDSKPCLAHEIGHAIDSSNDWVSETEEFQKAVDLSLEMLEDDRTEFCSWCYIAEQILATSPGINGNPLLKDSSGNEWGGYSELYANIFAYSTATIENLLSGLSTIDIPSA